MEVNLGHFKNVFLLESLYGTCTVSLTTLEQSKVKIAYSSLLLSVYIGEMLFYLYVSNPATRDWPNIIYLMITLSLPLYSLTKTMFEYKSRISAALDLVAIDEKLQENQIYVPGNSLLRTMSISLVVSNIITQIMGLASRSLDQEDGLPFAKYIIVFQFYGTHLTQGVSLIMFLRKIVMIQSAITKAFANVKLEQQEPTTLHYQRSRNRGRRNIRLQTEVDKKWALLTELQGSLYATENTIYESYRIQISWYRLIVEIVGPFLIFSYIDQTIPAMRVLYFIRILFIFVSIVYAVEKVYKEKETALLEITNYEENDSIISQNRVKLQVLANIHRSRVPFSCSLFDIDYALLATILENFFFVTTSILANLAKTN